MLTVCTVLFECTIWSIVGKMRNVIDNVYIQIYFTTGGKRFN